MKKFSLFVFFIFLVKFTLHAQPAAESKNGFYVSAGGGFGIGECYYDPCDYYNEDYYPTYDNLKSLNFAPGKGFNVNVAAGYMFTKNIGAQLTLRDFFGLPIKEYYNNDFSPTNSSTENFKYKGMMFQVIPSIILDLGLDKFDPYARFGLVIGAISQIKYYETDVQGKNTWKWEGKYTGSVPLGYSAAIGVKYKLTENWGIFGEFDCNGINYTPKKYKVTKYSENGADMLSKLTVRQSQINFVKSYDASQTIPSSSPDIELKQTFPFNNFEINVGVILKL